MVKTVVMKKNSTQSLAIGLSQLLADTYTLYLQTQNFHWNVKGMNFSSLHLLFEAQYTELASAVDVIAERIRSLGELAPGSYAEFAKLTKCQQITGEISADKMLHHLIHLHQIIVETAKMVCDNSESVADQVSLDLAISRIAAHEKILWMLKSILD